MSREDQLVALGYPLDRIPAPAALYQPLVVARGIAYVSGCLPFDGPGQLMGKGKLGREVSVEDGRYAAALCAANILRVLVNELGTLDRVARMVRIAGYVHSTEDFSDQHLVLNGASELLVRVLGVTAGTHARTAMGVAQLPLGASVEVDAIVELHP